MNAPISIFFVNISKIATEKHMVYSFFCLYIINYLQVYIYVQIMCYVFQGKFEEALQVVEGPLGEKLVSYVFVPLKRASLLMKLERWQDSNILFKLLLREE